MKKVKKAVVEVSAFVLLTILTMSMSVAYASPPTTISGKWAMTGVTNIEEKQAGSSNIGFQQIGGLGFFVGGISGPFSSDASWTGHNVDQPNMWVHGHVVITISPAVVMGKTGSLTFMFNGNMGEGGNWVIIGGTGDLAILHGNGNWSPTGGFPQLTYEGQVHFEP